MNCPVCRNVALDSAAAQIAPRRLPCPNCAGCWLPGKEFWTWLESQNQSRPPIPSNIAAPPPAIDSPAGKLCPECGRFLRHSRVGHGVEFNIDRCTACGGFWFDRNEWEILRAHGLDADVHFIFSAAWQKALADEDRRAEHEARVASILGPTDFARTKDFKSWMNTHPKHATIAAYLTDLHE